MDRETIRVKLTGNLRGSGSHQRDKTGSVDNTALAAAGILSHLLNSVLAAPPDPLAGIRYPRGQCRLAKKKSRGETFSHVDLESEVKDALLCVEGVVVGRVHDTSGIINSMRGGGGEHITLVTQE